VFTVDVAGCLCPV